MGFKALFLCLLCVLSSVNIERRKTKAKNKSRSSPPIKNHTRHRTRNAAPRASSRPPRQPPVFASTSNSNPNQVPIADEFVILRKDYWALAVKQLKEENPSFQGQIRALQNVAADTGDPDFATQLLNATHEAYRDAMNKQWTISSANGSVRIRDAFQRIVQSLNQFKDFLKAAGNIDPVHLGLPLAGLCVLMQVGQRTVILQRVLHMTVPNLVNKT